MKVVLARSALAESTVRVSPVIPLVPPRWSHDVPGIMPRDRPGGEIRPGPPAPRRRFGSTSAAAFVRNRPPRRGNIHTSVAPYARKPRPLFHAFGSHHAVEDGRCGGYELCCTRHSCLFLRCYTIRTKAPTRDLGHQKGRVRMAIWTESPEQTPTIEGSAGERGPARTRGTGSAVSSADTGGSSPGSMERGCLTPGAPANRAILDGLSPASVYLWERLDPLVATYLVCIWADDPDARVRESVARSLFAAPAIVGADWALEQLSRDPSAAVQETAKRTAAHRAKRHRTDWPT